MTNAFLAKALNSDKATQEEREYFYKKAEAEADAIARKYKATPMYAYFLGEALSKITTVMFHEHMKEKNAKKLPSRDDHGKFSASEELF